MGKRTLNGDTVETFKDENATEGCGAPEIRSRRRAGTVGPYGPSPTSEDQRSLNLARLKEGS